MSAAGMGVGIDLVDVSRVAESLDRFGERFLRRVFTQHEIDYATSAPAQAHARLAARFAAKEATFKALQLGDVPMNWTEIEVVRFPEGHCELVLRGATREAADARGISALSVSLSHEGGYATAIVITQSARNQES